MSCRLIFQYKDNPPIDLHFRQLAVAEKVSLKFYEMPHDTLLIIDHDTGDVINMGAKITTEIRQANEVSAARYVSEMSDIEIMDVYTQRNSSNWMHATPSAIDLLICRRAKPLIEAEEEKKRWETAMEDYCFGPPKPTEPARRNEDIYTPEAGRLYTMENPGRRFDAAVLWAASIAGCGIGFLAGIMFAAMWWLP